MVALFWAFTNASVDADTAESSYGLVVAFAQLGAVGGSALATQARRLHISFLYVLGGCSCALVCGMVALFEYYFAEEVPEEARQVASAVDESDDDEPTTRTREEGGTLRRPLTSCSETRLRLQPAHDLDALRNCAHGPRFRDENWPGALRR